MSKNRDPKTQIRKAKLELWIRQRCEDNRNLAARLSGKPRHQITDLLSPTRSFGAQIARELETKLGMPPNYLDVDDKVVPVIVATGWPFRFHRKLFDDLHGDEKLIIEGMVLGRIAAFDETPSAAGKKSRRASDGAKS